MDLKDLEMAKRIKEHLKVNTLPKAMFDDDKEYPELFENRTDDEVLMKHFYEDSLHSVKTVRFLKDYYHYRARPDLSTKNESFIRTAELFRKQGIVNNAFHLQINNPMLVGVDPYAEDLTNEQETWILEECRSNFWYFLREVCQLKKGQSFMANRGNISFIWNYLNHIKTYMIMPRQQGKALDDETLVRVPTTTTSTSCWRRIGDLCTGDKILDSHGEETMIIGVHPQGNKRLYTVTFSDGRTSRACAEHLWTVYDKKRGHEGCWVDYPTSALIDKLDKPYYKSNPIEIPTIKPTDGIKLEHIISPYSMGVLYSGKSGGDYRVELNERNMSLVNDIKYPSELIVKQQDDVLLFSRPNGMPYSFESRHGLPKTYLEGTVEDKLGLLHGFMDVLGSATDDYRLRIKEPVVEAQIQYLVRSLGGTAKKVNKDLVITLPEGLDYFRNAVWTKLDIENKLTVVSVEYHSKSPATCIEVDGIDQLFVTEDFVVTHNTVSVQVINFWLTYINGRGYKSHVITLKSDNRAQFIDAVKRIRTCIPRYLVNTTYKDKDSGTYLTYKAFGEEVVNTLTISVPQQGEAAAGDLGRGLTVGTTVLDEPGYISFIEAIVNGCMPSALTEMANCRAAGLPHGLLYITTPNTVQHPSGAYMYDKLMSATEWRETFFDSYSESHLARRLLKASPNGGVTPNGKEQHHSAAAVSMVYNYLQLGKNRDWVQDTIAQLGLSLSKAKIDLLLMWTEDGEARLFDDLTREAINNTKRGANWSKEYRSTGLFIDFFVPKEEFAEMCTESYNDFFLIGVDTSSAVNKDACTLVLRSIKTGKVVGVGRYPLAFLDDVADVIVDILQCVPNSMLVIERNYAHHMIDNLLVTLPALGMDPFRRIFNTVYQDNVKYKKEWEEVQRTKPQHRTKEFYLRLKAHFGFTTNAKTRDEFYGYINEAVAVTGYGIHYDKLADELINLRIKGGRIDHDLNKHDDLVVSWLLTYWFIKRGLNKSHYGYPIGLQLIETKNLLSNHEEVNDPNNDPKVVEALRYVREKVQTLTEELMGTNDNLLALRLEGEIRRISQHLPVAERKVHTVDTVLDAAKTARLQRIMKLKNRKYAA